MPLPQYIVLYCGDNRMARFPTPLSHGVDMYLAVYYGY